MDRHELVGDAELRVWDSYAHGEPVELGPGAPYLNNFDIAQWGMTASSGRKF